MIQEGIWIILHKDFKKNYVRFIIYKGSQIIFEIKINNMKI